MHCQRPILHSVAFVFCLYPIHFVACRPGERCFAIGNMSAPLLPSRGGISGSDGLHICGGFEGEAKALQSLCAYCSKQYGLHEKIMGVEELLLVVQLHQEMKLMKQEVQQALKQETLELKQELKASTQAVKEETIKFNLYKASNDELRQQWKGAFFSVVLV